MAIYGQMVVPSKAGGGSLPTNNETPTPYVPGVGVNARFSDAGAQIAGQAAAKAGEGFGNLGKGLQKLGGFGMIMASRENRLDLARADEAFAALQTEAIAKQTEWEKLKGLQGVDVLEMKAKWWDDAHARHMEGLGDAGKRYYNLQSDRLGVTLDQWASRYGENQRTAYEKQAIAFGMDSEANAMMLAPLDFDSVDRSLAHIKVMVDRSAMTQGLDANTANQMYQAAASKAVGNTLGMLLGQGKITEAEAFIGRYGGLMTAADHAKANEQYNQAVLARARTQGNADDWRGIAQLAGGGANQPGAWNMVVASQAQRLKGTPYQYGTMRDCSGYTTTVWKPLIADPSIRAELFGGEGGRGTSEGIVVGAAKHTAPGGKPLRNEQLQPGMVGPGMVIGLDTGRHGKRDAGRQYGMDHIVWTYMGQDGVLMVSESSGGGRGVHDTPYEEWYRNNSHNKLYGASLVPLLQGNQPAGPGAPSGFVEYTGKDRGNSIPERQHNPGAVKPPKGYSTFKSDAEGFLAQAEALRNEKYYGGKTIEQIVLTYVGYNPKPSYWAKVKEQGFDLKEVPNLKDNKVLARLMIGLARGESPLGKHYEPEQIEALLAGGAQARPQAQAQAPAAKLSGGAKDMYDMVESNIRSGNMSRQQAEAFLQESMQKAKAKSSSQDATTKKMAEGDYEAARQALAALQQGQPQAGAPVQAPAMQAGSPVQQGMPMQAGYPAQGNPRGFFLTQESQGALAQLQGDARARSLSRELDQQIDAGAISYGQAQAQANQIQDEKLRLGVLSELSRSNGIRQTLERETVDKAAAEAGVAIEGIQKRFDGGDESGAAKQLWDMVKQAQNAHLASPRDKGLKAKYKVLKEAYSAMTGGASLATDPEVFNQLAEGIANGTITTEDQLIKVPAYTRMASKDKNGLKTLMKNLQKVDRQTLQSLFNDIIGSPMEPGIDKETRAKRQAQWKQIQLDVAQAARETNLGSNEEWLKKQVERYAVGTVTPKPWFMPNGEATVGEERVGERHGDYLPQVSEQELNAAGAVLGRMPKAGVEVYQEMARKWVEKHSTFSDKQNVAKYLFLRSQQEAQLRAGRPPARPAGVPEKAQWVNNEQFGWGWQWSKPNGREEFEPYIFKPRVEG